MYKKLKTIIILLLINISLVCSFVFVNTLAFSIPKEVIFYNVQKSQYEFEAMNIPTTYDCSYLNEVNYAAWIAMAYCGEEDKSALYNGINMLVPAKGHYFGAHNIKDAISGDFEGESYTRYWHGAVAMLRFLLFFGSHNQILLTSEILIWFLLILSTWLIYKKDKILAFCYLFSIVLSTFHIVAQSCYYMVDYFVFFIVVILTISHFINLDWQKFTLWLTAIGAVTCYYDGLVVPVLTVGYPLAIYVYLKKDYNYKKIMIAGSCWAFGYLFAILSKWTLADIICHIDIFSYFTGDYQDLYNLHLPLLQYMKRISFIFVASFAFVLGLCILRLILKREISLAIVFVYVLIFLIPVAFCIADWHPFTFHYWMTHRNWSVAYFAAMVCMLDIYYQKKLTR